MEERDFQKNLIKDIEKRFPGSMIMKTDPRYIQGIPDLLILYKDRWALLEVKASEEAKHQPNQDGYVEKLNGMSFSAFIYPSNKEEVLNDLEQSFLRRSRRKPRFSGSK